jgi:HD superfamily phosphohydrolase
MYTSVYFHKTVRIAELMLSRAIEEVASKDPFRFFRMTDLEMMNVLQEFGEFQREIMIRLKYRELFKQACAFSLQDLNTEERAMVKKLEDISVRREMEQKLEEWFSIPHGHVIIDVPRPELLRAEPRINRTDIGVIEGNMVRSLDEFTPIAQAIRSRVTPDWSVMIISDEKYREVLMKKGAQVLFS